jgi:hypothetical protein
VREHSTLSPKIQNSSQSCLALVNATGSTGPVGHRTSLATKEAQR